MTKIKSVFVVPPRMGVDQLFHRWGFPVVDNIKKADAVVFTGGEDVNPELYGERPLRQTYFSRERDAYEVRAYEFARQANKPMIGICRGGQLLNVLVGGKLWQHVDQHAIGGDKHTIKVFNPDGKFSNETEVTSAHHQMMRPTEQGIILGSTSRSKMKMSADEIRTAEHHLGDDVEIVWYPKQGIYCFQGHPEWDIEGSTSECFFGLLNELYAA